VPSSLRFALLACALPIAAILLPAAAQEDRVLAYTVDIADSGDADLDAAIRALSQLVALQEKAPTDAGGVLARTEGDRVRLARALESEGFFGGSIGFDLAGDPLGTPGLIERLDGMPGPIVIRLIPAPGERYRLGRIDIAATTPAEAGPVAAAMAAPFELAVGDPARAAPILAAEQILRDRLLAAGHPLAVVASREAVVFHDRREMDVAWRLAPGPAAVFAAPDVTGSERVDGDFVRQQAGRLGGIRYSPAALETARADLMRLGAFGTVRARAGDRLDALGRLPVTFAVTERPRRAIALGLGYETNYGISVRASWEHRNLFGRAERLRIEGEVARIGQGGSVGDATYRLGISLRQPGVPTPDDALTYSVGGVRERLDAYDRDAVFGSVLLERRLSPRLTWRAGPVFEVGADGPPGGTLTDYQIAGVTGGGRWDFSDNLLDPSRGWRLDASITPSISISEQQPFAPLRATGSVYFDVLGDRDTVLALRGSVGSLLGANVSTVPRYQRYYGGGGGSVRGYDYQSIGPRDDLNRPSGGAGLVELSAEWRQRVWRDLGAVAFIDAGSVSSGSAPDTSQLRVGAGLGVRYRTPIGPLRADIGVPLVKQQGNSAFGLYVGIGQAF